VRLDRGLYAEELAAAEECYGFRFPPDLQALLSAALPLGDFPNWRALGSPEIADRLRWPLHGIQFDIEHRAFWWPAWGARPTQLDEALATAEREIAAAPFLIPVYSHRYLPAEPSQAGNPVLSVHQTDIIYYGRELRSYLANEFGGRRDAPNDVDVRQIRFWSDVIAMGSEPAN
jgi:hypothetical protein